MARLQTLIVPLDAGRNNIYVKREDLIPFSFGGNKVRKAAKFFEEIDAGDYDCVVTYGGSSSNHCRIVSNMAKSRGLDCYIIGPKEKSEETFNKNLIERFSRELTYVPVNEVSATINRKMATLSAAGKKPYFIEGGGHGDLGTDAYVECYKEILDYEKKNDIIFDYIFLASGTGCTQAGLVCGSIMNKDSKKIIGISIARPNPRGRDVVVKSVKSYLSNREMLISDEQINQKIIFDDQYVKGGYGVSDDEIHRTILTVLEKYGLPLDPTYTGKAYHGMLKYLQNHNITDSNILFIHTGGAPLFFDFLKHTKGVK